MAKIKGVSEVFEGKLVVIRPSQTAMPDSGDLIGIVETADSNAVCMMHHYCDGAQHDENAPHYEIRANLRRLDAGKAPTYDRTSAINYKFTPTLIGTNSIATMRVIEE
jgi:hypothetical protein